MFKTTAQLGHRYYLSLCSYFGQIIMTSSVSVCYRNTSEVREMEVLVVVPVLLVRPCCLCLYNDRASQFTHGTFSFTSVSNSD